ncbi:hypothetical protein ETD83_14160 [Actinomadura soli]|uniref:Phosphotransferase family enzyme n=1 Tax=Actinomadura soli TaxID=2508997 RepID=A0A5C4JE95_9ACTN|nr:hypothetical protein [Actinomadura soli]TMR01689.1 hypothetical protein ETD83_14160 [Actinomadura soli]
MSDTADRLAALSETTRLLWPEPARVAFGSGGRLLAPGARRPRILLPADRAAAVAALRAYGRVESRAARLVTAGLIWSLRGGLGRAVLRQGVRVDVPDGAETVETYLSEALGRPVCAALYARPAGRANDKPVLQALSPGASGPPVAFVKVGVNELTGRLVRAEAAALERLPRAAGAVVRAPEVLHFGSWRGLDVLALTPLPTWEPGRPVAPDTFSAALREIAGAAGTQRIRLAGSPYWSVLNDRVAALPGEAADRLRAALAAIGEHHGDAEIVFGSWHGDFTPWNTAGSDGGLLVWDWERFAADVPVGFDALHHRLQRAVSDPAADPARAAAECVRDAAGTLAPFGAEPPHAPHAPLVARLYLAELAARYLADRQAEAGARLGDVGAWLLPALTEGMHETKETNG